MSEQTWSSTYGVLAGIADEMPVPLALTEGTRHTLRYANQPFLRSIGSEANAALGQPLLETLPSTQHGDARALFDRVLATGMAEHGVMLGTAANDHTPTRPAFKVWRIPADGGWLLGVVAHAYGVEDGASALHESPIGVAIREVNERLLLSGLRAQADVELEAALNAALRQANEALTEGESRFRALAETVPQLVWFSSPTGQIEYVNQRWSEYTGASPDWPLEEPWAQAMLTEDQANAAAQLARGLATREPVEAEYRLRRHDGAYRWFLARIVPLRDTAGLIERWFGTATDIHDQKEAVRLRDEFLSIAAHELRAPITGIKGTAQLAMRGIDRDALDLLKARQYFETVNAISDRASALINDLLDLSRIQAGQLQTQLAQLDLGALVRRIVDSLHGRLMDHHVLDVVVPTDPVWIKGDIVRLEQVLGNLLENAVKYSPEGGLLRVTLTQDAAGTQLSVQDDGIGLPEGAEEQIFQPFARASNAVEHALPGVGIGLYVSRMMVEMQGGRLWAESGGEGLGTAMHIWLPQLP